MLPLAKMAYKLLGGPDLPYRRLCFPARGFCGRRSWITADVANSRQEQRQEIKEAARGYLISERLV